jgi:uncharacterized protein YjbI with pentapeptide repeats
MNWASIFSDYWRELLVLWATAISTFLFWLYWPRRATNRLPIPDPKERANVEDNFRKTAGQLIGGAAVLLGAGFAYLQFQQQQKAAQDLLISNQVAKSFELLGNKEKDPMQQLGGIYALEGVMNTSQQYQKPVLEALCAFVRLQTENLVADELPTPSVQAALTVIGRREVVLNIEKLGVFDLLAGTVPVNLKDAQIPYAVLLNATLEAAHLNYVNMNHAILLGANLSRADLSDAKLIEANLIGADMNHALLIGADIRDARLDGTNLDAANLTNADLRGAKNLSQEQLDQACGTDVKLDPPLKLDNSCLIEPHVQRP